ncbi:MAG: pyridoxal phosphate-dependent aminotransferase [Fimbriimonadaceae bacterium]|nr:pyridoxal phosphate-dependent aminotransferase [Fimbriimonadaceae bacterium]QYK55827.1 MAG: pyridoxal phosphate-dependent aminotransferase [Fimbriimonadaceae bacterium]
MPTRALASRTALLQASPTLAITARAKQMKAEGKDVISFAAGEPDFNTPEAVCTAAKEALDRGFTKYTASAGTPELREAVAAKFWRENGLRYDPRQVIVTCGAKQAVFNSLQVLVEPGDEVLLLAPYWMTYADQIRLAGGQPVVVPCDPANDYQPDFDRLKAAVTPRTKAVIVNSPSNPTGAGFDRGVVKELAALALRHDLWIISDEIYEHLVYDFEPVSPASLGSEVYDRTVTISGCSKSYAMTGWRIGYLAAPLPVATAISALQDQVTSNPTSFAQCGALVALKLPDDTVQSMRAEFAARRELMLEGLASLSGVKTVPPKGAFYCFPDVSPYLGGRFADDAELAKHLLEEALVATIPGSVFEGPGHIRLSYAASREDISRGLERLADCLERAT